MFLLDSKNETGRGVFMTHKGDYRLDFNSDKVIIDGNEFIRTEIDGIYKSIDEYDIYKGDWISDIRNKDISFFGHRKIGKSKYRILYVFRYDNVLQSKLEECDEILNATVDVDEFVFTSCIYNTSFDHGFTRGELNI